jgi:parallel beta-helix repeat protein
MLKRVVFLKTAFTATMLLLGITASLFNFPAKSARLKEVRGFQSEFIWVPDNYTTIQAAVNAANAGDIIRVRNGTYYENIQVNQSVSLLGEDFPTICGDSVGMFGAPTVDIRVENVTICGFVIRHYDKINERDSGINFRSRGNITGNIVRHNIEGIKSGSGCDYNIISNNLIEDNGVGLRAGGVWNNITDNIVINNGDGTEIHNSHVLINNTIANNRRFGLQFSAWNSTLRNNTMIDNGYNFMMWETVLSQEIDDIDTSNTVNGRPIYYWINQSNKDVPADAGYVAIINSTNIRVDGLDLDHNGEGILVAHSSNVTVSNCNLTDSWFGARVVYSNSTSLYRNNFVNNLYQYEINWEYSWDDGYPSGGNYWSNYNGTDNFSGAYQNETGSDGIADQPFAIVDMEYRYNNKDDYPLMAPVNVFDVGEWNGTKCKVHVVSNSTLSAFTLNETEKTIRFSVTGENGSGFCRATIPNIIIQNLWQNNYAVLIDNQPPLEMRNWTDPENTYLYFTYQHSQHEITIIPENSSTTILAIFTALTNVALLLAKKKQSATQKNRTK